MKSETAGDYHVRCLDQHLDDNYLCQDTVRWWLECHEQKLDQKNVTVYVACILFFPNSKINQNNYMLWSAFVHFTDPKYYIRGPFNYDSHKYVMQPKPYLALNHWDFSIL